MNAKAEGRLIIAMGMGVATTTAAAAQAAVDQALMQSSLNIVTALKIAPSDMRVKANIGVQTPEALSGRDITVALEGSAEVNLVKGGQDVVCPQTGARSVVAVAAVEVFLPKQTGWSLTNQ